jgi:superfamily I DNA/RNA helicase
MDYPNHELQQIRSHFHGSLLGFAPTGSGKTRILSDHLAAIIAAEMRSELTLGVTFTNRTADYMRTSVRESCDPAAKQTYRHPSHSFL